MTKQSGLFLTLGAGFVGGVLAGRLLPIGIAAGAGALRAAAGKDPFAKLIREHGELLRLLDDMETLPAERTAKRRALAYWFMRKISKHAMAEEDLVYPLLHDEADRQEQALKLYAEHGRMKVLLFELERAVHTDRAWLDAVRGLRAEIEPHARQEEEEEFPRLRAVLDRSGRIEAGRKIGRFEAIIV